MIRVIRHHASVGVLPLLISEVLLLGGCFLASAEVLYPPSGWYYMFLEGGVTVVAIAIATIVAAMYFFDMYAEVQISSRIILLQQLCQALGVAVLAQTVAIYMFRDWTVPHLMMLCSSALALFVLFCWRLIFSALVKHLGVIDKILFLGHSETSDAVAKAIEAKPNSGYRVIGFLDDHVSAGVLGRLNSLPAMVAEHKPSLVVVGGGSDHRSAMPVADLVALRFAGMQIEEASRTFESVYQRVRLADLSEQQVMFSRVFAARPGALRLERLTSFTLALACLMLSSPLLLFLAIWLRFRSTDPVLLKLPRAGKGGRTFTMLRFRRDASLKRLFDRFRVDALPELVNVLRGDMSLVGPYPETPEMLKSLLESLPFFEYRLAVPPGVTGWAQINQKPATIGNRAVSLEYDLYYIKHMSLALNLYILAHSLKNGILRP